MVYVRPALPRQVVLDDDGRPLLDAAGDEVEYGHRWPGIDDHPPADLYSHVSHPERFAPLHEVADALVAHLVATYDVTAEAVAVDDAAAVAEALGPSAPDLARALALTPADASCAPLVVGFTRFPGLYVRAGALHLAAFPPCGCDACDDPLPEVADALERFVAAVATGRFREWIDGRKVGFEEAGADGSASGWGLDTSGKDAARRRREARARLAALPGGWWQPWPQR
jgi:hypothetical protein